MLEPPAFFFCAVSPSSTNTQNFDAPLQFSYHHSPKFTLKNPGINYRAIHGEQQQTFISYSLEDFFMSYLYSGKYTSQYSPRESQPMGHRWFGDADDRQIDR